MTTGQTMRRARHLLRAGRLTRTDIAVLDCLLFSCRTPGKTAFAVSYTRLARLARAARGTVIRAVERLIAAGLLCKTKRHRLVAWGAGIAWRQVTNLYSLCCEFNPAPVYQEQGRKQEAREGSWWRSPAPCPPLRTVAEQLALLAPIRQVVDTLVGRSQASSSA